MSEQILFVDDDKQLLSIFELQFKRHFDVTVSDDPEEALGVIKKNSQFSVIVSDMKMGVNDGADFLSSAQRLSPESTRIVLSAYSDSETALSAINNGHVFRYLTKPCPQPLLLAALNDGIRQYHLVTTERDLLKKTVNECVKALIDVLGLTNPLAFGRANRIRRLSSMIAKYLELGHVWKLEIAALLSQLGFVSIPVSTLEKIYSNKKLTQSEKEMLLSYPNVSKEIVKDIPRLEFVGLIINRLQNDFDPEKAEVPVLKRSFIEVGAEIIKLAAHFDTVLFQSSSNAAALRRIKKNAHLYNPQILNALDSIEMLEVDRQTINATAHALEVGSVLAEDVLTPGGVLLGKAGQEITQGMIHVLMNNVKQGIITDDFVIFKAGKYHD